MTTTCCPAKPPAPPSFSSPSAARTAATGSRRGLWQALRRLGELARQRRALGEMEPHRLDDIGLSAEEARREAARPFWDAPEHWHRRP